MRLARTPVTVVLTALAPALVLVVVLLPTSGVDTQPPVCWATGGYEVTCSQAPAWVSATTVLLLGGLVAWRFRQKGEVRNKAR